MQPLFGRTLGHQKTTDTHTATGSDIIAAAATAAVAATAATASTPETESERTISRQTHQKNQSDEAKQIFFDDVIVDAHSENYEPKEMKKKRI